MLRMRSLAGSAGSAGWGACVLVFAVACALLWTGVVAHPGAAEASTTVSSDITSNTTWTSGGSPYIVTPSILTVDSGVTLTVDPGVVVKFESGKGMQVSGTLVANGTSGSPITFTSVEDDSDGNDSSSDGASSGSPGDWATLEVSGSGSSATFSHAVIEYGGPGASRLNHMLSVDGGGTVTVTDSTISHAQETGLAVGGGSEADLTRTKVASNGGDGVYVGDGVLSMVDSAAWLNGTNGVEVVYSTAPSTQTSVTGSSIWGNAGFGVETNLSGIGAGPTPTVTGSNIYDNGSFAPGSSLNQVDIGQRSDADWSGNYWAQSGQVVCGTSPHLVDPEIQSLGFGFSVQRGPVSSSNQIVGGDICAFDNVPDVPAAKNQISTFFKTPPPVYGGVSLQALFGCAACTKQLYSMLDGLRGIAGTPASQLPGSVNYVGDPVNPATGTLTETSDDVHINGPGVPFDLVRTYNSRDTDSGMFGVGWSSTYEASLSFPDSSTVIYRSGDGQQTTFIQPPFADWVSTGIPAKLAKVDDGGGAYHWTLTTTDKRVFSFNPRAS